jgi:hypothetical protein
VEKIIDEGENAVMDRGYQSHAHFDQWQTDEKHFVCRIKKYNQDSFFGNHPKSGLFL